jgi:hypothetical protein
MYLESNERQINNDHLLRIDDYTNYNFKDNPGYVKYTICRYEEMLCWDEITGNPVLAQDGTQAYLIYKWPETEGTLNLTINLINQWGSDDQPVFDYVIQELGL